MEKVDRPNTLIATIPDEFLGLSHSAIVDKLVSCLGADGIRHVQFVPRCYARITFATFDARNSALMSGIFLDSTRLFVVEADPVFKDVYLEHLPVEVSDDLVREVLSPFGTVPGISGLNYPGTSIGTGTRLIKMSLASDIPVNIRILRYPCRVSPVRVPFVVCPIIDLSTARFAMSAVDVVSLATLHVTVMPLLLPLLSLILLLCLQMPLPQFQELTLMFLLLPLLPLMFLLQPLLVLLLLMVLLHPLLVLLLLMLFPMRSFPLSRPSIRPMLFWFGILMIFLPLTWATLPAVVLNRILQPQICIVSASTKKTVPVVSFPP